MEAAYVATFAVIVGGSRGIGHGSCIRMFVVDGGQGIRVTGSIASRTEIRAHPEGGVGWASALDDDIGTLTDT